MKILLAFPQADKRTGKYLKNAIEMAGHEIICCDPKVEAEKLLGVADAFRPDTILCSRSPELAEHVQAVKRKFPSTVIVCWNVDVRNSVADFIRIYGKPLKKLFRMSDFIYTAAAGNVAEYQELYPQARAGWLPQGIDPAEHVVGGCPSNYEWDVSFLGSVDKFHERACGRIALMEKLAQYHDIKRKPSYRRDASMIYWNSKVNIGNNAFPNIEKTFSVRDFKIMAAGGFLLTNHVKGIHDVFKVRRNMDIYQHPLDCLNKVKFYLDNDETRRSMASQGRQWVLDNHTYSHRIAKIVADMRTA